MSDAAGSHQFTPPSFEPYLGRVMMVRTLTAMGGFVVVGALTYTGGAAWDAAVIRATVTAIALYFVAWGLALFLFGELYHAQVEQARQTIHRLERERNEKIEAAYKERLQASGMADANGNLQIPDNVHPIGGTSPITPPEAARKAA